MATVVIVGAAAFFVGMGVYALMAPSSLVQPFGIVLEGPTARNEVRAVYGGFGLAVAGLLVAALLTEDLRAGIVTAVGVALLGMALGRVLGRAVDRPPRFYPTWFYFGVELGGGGLLLLAAR